MLPGQNVERTLFWGDIGVERAEVHAIELTIYVSHRIRFLRGFDGELSINDHTGSFVKLTVFVNLNKVRFFDIHIHGRKTHAARFIRHESESLWTFFRGLAPFERSDNVSSSNFDNMQVFLRLLEIKLLNSYDICLLR